MSKVFINAKLLKKRNLWINIIIFILSYLVLYRYFDKINLGDFASFLKECMASMDAILLMSLILVLAFFNWVVETFKWKYLIAEVVDVSFANSFKSILIGIFFSLFIPNRAGDFIGRVYSVPEQQKGRLSVLTLFGSFAQLITTILFGTIGFTYFIVLYFSIANQQTVLILLAATFSWIALIVSIILFFKSSLLSHFRFFKRNRFLSKVNTWIEVLNSVSSRKMLIVLFLSTLRYLIFSYQLWLSFRLVGVDISGIDLYFFIAVYYLFLTFIPTVVYSEIGVRGSLSIYLFGLLMFVSGAPEYDYQWAVTFATVFVWVVNIILPAIVGSFFTHRLKFYK